MPRQLRSIIKTPARYADRDDAQSKPRNGTRPEYPALLQATIVPFNPNHPPAAFPSLPLTGQKSHQEMVTNPTDLPEAPPGPTSLSLISPGPTRDLVNRYEAEYYRNGRPLLGSLGLPPAVGDSDEMAASDAESVILHPREAFSLDPEAPTWASLPLSLQYHIYMTLSEQCDRDKLCRVLGLTNQEKDDIETAVQDRHDHPYSLAELWSYGCHHSAPVPGIDGPNTSIDPDLLDKLMPDMLLVSRYELAYESEVVSAAGFLSSRSLPPELLGHWVPDTDGLESICPAGMLRQQDNQTGETEVEPGESSTAERDCTVGEAHETEVAKSKPKAQNKKRQLQSPAARAVKKAQGTKKKVPKKRGPKPAAPKVQKKRGPHPLATVTTPDSSGSPKSRSRKKTQKKATTGGPRRLSLIFKPAVGGGKPTIQQQQKQPPRPCTPERPSSSHITAPGSSAGRADQTPTTRLLSFDTKMSSFSRELILNEEGSSPGNNAVESSPISVASASEGGFGRAATPTPAATVLSKRKASPSDLRLSPPQIPRVSSSAGVKSYWRKSTINSGGNIDNCCYHGRPQTAFGTGPASTGMDTNAHAQMDKAIPSIEAPASVATATNQDAVRPPGTPRRPSYSPISENADDEEWQALLKGKTRFHAPGSPRRPSYSPITENEDDEEWQAKLRGPVAGNTKPNYRTGVRFSAPSALLPVTRESKRSSLASAWLAADNRPSIDRNPSSGNHHTLSSSANDRGLSGSVASTKTTGSGSLPLRGASNSNKSATSSFTSTPRLKLVLKRRSEPKTLGVGETEARPSIVEEVLAEMKEEQEQGIASRTRSSLSRMGTATPAPAPAPAVAEPTTKKTKGTTAAKKKPAKKTVTATAAANAKSGNKVQKSTAAKKGPNKKTKTLEKRQARVAGEKARRRLSL
ncbi:hypothetical protein HRR83_005270 [Exophiala dermatitidis]|uniref:Uncharacterized protein n=1 Tax=Exophiala dermatitidis TaxID=5970 RepID=A0AAN6EVG6_EXODE|nr:hypothetical protein HRR75_004694 [Exophiala dermatitidis]KAJ4515965.1 hypothetical protein HRR74_005122 [Exophiala dermatitidis]KAJ4518629.1 hypothetical protein HRR73_004210 [Exophiala dermatitidis]KAJ4534142.1 hypothetical protein HRR76_006076 [Exophiala dermatitidis]KAJ4550295.1 hypothetical protein HRR77_003762 [Exophiala dermatitidis]